MQTETPQDHRAERQLISLISLYPEFYNHARALQATAFHDIEATRLWAKLSAAIESGNIPDPLDYIEFHDPYYPVTPLPEVARELAGRVTAAAYSRDALQFCSEIAKAAYKQDLPALQSLFAQPPAPASTNSSLTDAATIASQLFDEIGTEADMLHTGLEAYDKATGGLEIKTSHVLMARPGMGKTAALVQVADLAASDKKVVAVFTKEMSEKQWIRRMACRRARVAVNSIKTNRASESQMERYSAELIRIMGMKDEYLFIDGSANQTTADVLTICHELKRRHKRLDLVVADHLRLFSDKADNEVHRLGKISWAFKQLAKQLDTRCLVASQLSRGIEGASDKRPDLKDLRDSGEIEENADGVVALYRDRYYNPAADMSAEFLSRKARDGERNLASIAIYNEEYMSFDPAEVRHYNL